MQIFNYDKNGYFLGTSKADESPLEPGVYLIPDKATTVEPPIALSGKVPKWVGTEWVIANIPDAAPTEEPIRTPEEEREYQRTITKVTRFQAHAALLQAGLLADIKDYMSQPGTDEFIKLAWENVQEFRRMSPLVLSIAVLFNLNEVQLDDLFQFASTIEA